jgi:hypothetical protein
MEANERYQLQTMFHTASKELDDWAKCRKTALDTAKIVPEYWQVFKESASEKVKTLVNLGEKLLGDTELDEKQRKTLENKILGARHFEESLAP